MKRFWIFIILLGSLGSGIVFALSFDGEQKISSKKGEVLIPINLENFNEEIFVEKDNYELDSQSVKGEGELYLEEVHSMNDYLGFPEGNVLKLHSVCFDESLNQGYSAGILSSDIAVFKNDEVLFYIDSGLGKGAFDIKEVFCSGGIVLVADQNKIVKIDGQTGEILDTLDPQGAIFFSALTLNEEEGWITFPVSGGDANRVFYDLETFTKLGEVKDRQSAVITLSDGTILLVELKPRNGNFFLSLVDPQTFQKKQQFQLKTEEENKVEDVVYDPSENTLWFLTANAELLRYDLDTPHEPAFTLETLPGANHLSLHQNFLIVLSENGFQEDGTGSFLGGIEVFNTKTQESLYSKTLKYHHTALAVDVSNQELYITNNDDNSLTHLNLVDGVEIAHIELGSSSESGTLSQDGSLWVTNRLGGSSLFHLNLETGEFQDIELPWPWPVGIGYSPNLNKIFTYDFLNTSITSLDASSGEIIETYELEVPDGMTDAIGDMSLDHTRDIAYLAVPEQHLVLVVDLKTGTLLYKIPIEVPEDTDLQGPGKLIVATFEPTATLFVYEASTERLMIFDGLQDFELVQTLQIENLEGLSNYPYSFYVDQYQERVYLGENIFNARNFEHLGTLSYGQVVVAMDPKEGFLITSQINFHKETLFLLNQENELLDQIDTASFQYVSARFIYDAERNTIYLLYMVPSEVWEIQVQ